MPTRKAGKSAGLKISEIANADLSVSSKSRLLQPLSLKSRLNASAEHKKPFKIKDRYSGRVLFETEAETLRDALEEAVELQVKLTCADLRNADLGGACLAQAQLSNADFSGANLFNATLWKATLIGTRFCNVDLRSSNIKYANLKKAVLQNSELICTCFLGSNLTQADLRSSNLEGADLQGANLTGTSFDPRPMAPEKGSFVAWKRVFDERGDLLIAKLLIPEDAKRLTPLVGRVCRAEFVKVLELSRDASFAKCRYYPHRIYYVGGAVHDVSYCDDVQIGCSPYGIQFYLTYEEVGPDRGFPDWYPPLVSAVEYWKSPIYKGRVDGAKCINQPDSQKGRWQAGKLFDTSTARLMNQWDKKEKLQERPNDQTSLARCTPINPTSRTLEFYLSDAGHSVVPANLVSPLTIENHSQEYALSWEEGRVLQEFQVVYISKGKGVFQSTQSGLIPINAGDAFLLFPGEWHRYRPDPEVGWTQFWIRFSGDCANKLMSSEPLSSLKSIIRIGHNKALFQLFSDLSEVMYSKPFFNPWVCLLYTSPSPRD